MPANMRVAALLLGLLCLVSVGQYSMEPGEQGNPDPLILTTQMSHDAHRAQRATAQVRFTTTSTIQPADEVTAGRTAIVTTDVRVIRWSGDTTLLAGVRFGTPISQTGRRDFEALPLLANLRPNNPPNPSSR